ncbi:MAG TPA: hypothetical protein VN885_08115 [Candidatus Acidoferrales bacterium]|nr:hypothetical protein [Candidatus Acidoferrales bacterium]
MGAKKASRQDVTVNLDRETTHEAKIIAARRSSSISGVWAQQIASLVDEDEAYERARRHATAMLDQGFRLSGNFKISRDELHER